MFSNAVSNISRQGTFLQAQRCRINITFTLVSVLNDRRNPRCCHDPWRTTIEPLINKNIKKHLDEREHQEAFTVSFVFVDCYITISDNIAQKISMLFCDYSLPSPDAQNIHTVKRRKTCSTADIANNESGVLSTLFSASTGFHSLFFNV